MCRNWKTEFLDKIASTWSKVYKATSFRFGRKQILQWFLCCYYWLFHRWIFCFTMKSWCFKRIIVVIFVAKLFSFFDRFGCVQNDLHLFQNFDSHNRTVCLFCRNAIYQADISASFDRPNDHFLPRSWSVNKCHDWIRSFHLNWAFFCQYISSILTNKTLFSNILRSKNTKTSSRKCLETTSLQLDWRKILPSSITIKIWQGQFLQFKVEDVVFSNF